ncbi:MAG: hypothetical protein N3A54_03360 [Patescibacteria group bacterium]|nr:hypothetical protein [Patescibacteria group bacterium]
MDPVQIVIIGISIVLTTLFIALGVQMWFILKEIRGSIQRMNKMLDDAGKVTGAFGEGASNMSGLINGIKAGLSLAASMRKKGDDHD